MKLVESTVKALSTQLAPRTAAEGLALLRSCCFDAKKSSFGEVLDLLGEGTPAGVLDIWELHVKTKEGPVKAELFLLFTVLLGLRKHPATQEHKKKDRIKQVLVDVGCQLGTSWMKELTRSLNSKDFAKINAAFCLFAALAEIGEEDAARVVDVLKRASLPGPAKVDFWDICFQKREEMVQKKARRKEDPLSLAELNRTPHRDCFLDMTLALLHNCNAVCFLTLLSMKSVMSALLLKLSFDPPETIQEVLEVLGRRTVGGNADVPPKLKAEVFTPGVLCQLVFISGRSGGEAHQAGKLLLELCTNPRHGLLPCRNSTDEEQANAFRNMMEFMAFLKPHARSRHWFFLAKICRSCSRVAAEYLISGKINLNTQSPQDFLNGMGVLTDLIKYAGGCRMELVAGAQSHRLPPQNEDALVDRIVRWCVPPQVNKVTMGKSLQSKSPLICYGAIACLRRILLSIADILAVIGTAPGWEAVSLKLRLKLANVLPPHSVLMKVYWLQYKSNDADGKDLDEAMADVDGESSSSLRDRKILLLNGVLGILELCWKIGPELMPQGSLDALMNVLTEDIVGKNPAYQLAVIHALEQATKNRGAGYMRTLIPQKLKPVVRLLTETESRDVFLALEKLLSGWLEKFGFTSMEVEEIIVWLSLVPGKELGQIANRRHHAVLSFFTGAVCRMIKNPQALHEIQAEILRDFNCTVEGDESEVGVMCTGMLFNCLQVVFSGTQPSAEKVWIASYVAGAVNLFLLSSTCPIPAIMMIYGMLLKESHKRASENGSGLEMEKSRVALPREGFPLHSLWSTCTSVLRNVADENPAILDVWVRERAGLSISVEAFQSQILALDCGISSPKNESIERALWDQLDKAWSEGGTVALSSQTGSSSGSLEGEHDMQTLLLSLSGTQALGFLCAAIEKQPGWLRKQEFLRISSDVLKGHSLPVGIAEYLSKVLNSAKDSLWSFSLCLLIKATIESKELQGNGDMLSWLLETIQRIPATWRAFSIKYMMGALTRMTLCEGGGLKVVIALLDGLLFSGQLTLQEMEYFVTPILKHPALSEILSRDESGTSTESIVLFLKNVIFKLKDGPLGCGGRVVHSMQKLFGCLSRKYEGGRSGVDKVIARALTSVGPYVEAPIRESILEAIGRKQKERKRSVSSSIRALLLSFAWAYREGTLHFDWKCVGFLLGMDGLNPESEEVLLEGLGSGTPVDRAIFSKKTSLVAIMEKCLAVPEGLKGRIAAKLVKFEPVCQRMYVEDVVKKRSDASHLILCLPAAVNHLRGLSPHRSKRDVVAEMYGSALVDLFIEVSRDFSKVQLTDEGKRNLREFGSQALMLCVKCGGKTLWKKCWGDLLPALLPKKCWLEKPDEWRMDFLVMSGFFADHQLTQGVTAKNREKTLDCLGHLVSTCCVTFCNLVKERSKGGKAHPQELAYISNLLDGCLGDYLADVPNTHRTSASFDRVCTAAERVAISVMKYALNSPAEIRVVRRLFASLVPKEVSAGSSDQEDHEMIDAGSSPTENPRAVLVAKQVLDALLSHSSFLTAQQPQRPPLSSSLTSGAANLVYPVGSVLSVLGSDIEVSRGSVELTVGTLRTELAVLIETLLNMQTEFGMKIDYNSGEILKESNLMAVLLVGYEASLSLEDISVLHVLKLLDDRLAKRLHQGPTGSSQENLSPLAALGYIWGDDALKLHLSGLLVPRISGTSPLFDNAELEKLVWSTGPAVYCRRSAMTMVYFPELRTLAGSEGAEDIWGRGGPCGFDGGYDPSFLLQFCKAMVDRNLGKEGFWKSGLLALCLRASAAEDANLRKIAAEAVAKYRHWLSESDVKESNGILQLLRHFLVAVGKANQKLPTLLSLFFAEACMQLTSQENNMHAAISKMFVETEEWDVSAVPMWKKILSSVEQDGHQEWMVKLLAAGMVGTDSCSLYGRQNIIPALFALHDSKLVHPEARKMAIHVARKTTEIPALAGHLVDSAGLVSWLGDRAVHSGWQPSTVSSKLDNIEPNYACAIASIRALRSLVTANVGLDRRGGLLSEYIRTGWVLCKMATNYYEKEGSTCEVQVGGECMEANDESPLPEGRKGETRAGLKVGWSEKRGRLVGHMWWEVVLYVDALLKVCSQRGVASMSDVLEWKQLCDLLDGGAVFAEWISVDQTEIDNRLLEVVLKMATGRNDRVVAVEMIPYWERTVMWGLGVMRCRKGAEEWGDVAEAEKGIRKALKRTENMARSARFLLWMASCLLKGMSFPSELDESHLEELMRLHYEMTGEDQDATVLALLVCAVHLAQPAIEKFKKMHEALGCMDMIEKILPEMMSRVGFSRSALLCLWNKSSALGTRGSLQETSENPRIILSVIRELVGGSTRFDLTEKYLSSLRGGISGQAAE